MSIIKKARISADKRSIDAYGRSVEGYTYGSEGTITYQAYSVGDEVTYNNINYYVIKDSSASEESVTLLKAEPLTTAEVNQYGAGHVNMNVPSSESYYQTAYDSNGYGGMQ